MALSLELVPNSDSQADWSPSGTDYTKVDEGSDSINTGIGEYLFSTTNGQLELFQFENTTGGVQDGNIISVTLYWHSKEGGTAATKPVYYDGSSTVLGIARALTTSWTTFSQTYTTNPTTSNAWTKSEIDSARFGISNVVGIGRNTAYLAAIWIVVDYGYTNNVMGVDTDNISKVSDLSSAIISKVNGV